MTRPLFGDESSAVAAVPGCPGVAGASARGAPWKGRFTDKSRPRTLSLSLTPTPIHYTAQARPARPALATAPTRAPRGRPVS